MSHARFLIHGDFMFLSRYYQQRWRSLPDKNGVLGTDEHHLPRPPILDEKTRVSGVFKCQVVFGETQDFEIHRFLWTGYDWLIWPDIGHSPCSSSWRAQRAQLASQARRCGGQLLSAAEAVWVAQLAQLPERTQLRSYAVFQVNNESR